MRYGKRHVYAVCGHVVRGYGSGYVRQTDDAENARKVTAANTAAVRLAFNGNVSLYNTNANLGNAEINGSLTVSDAKSDLASTTHFGTALVKGATVLALNQNGSEAYLEDAAFDGHVTVSGTNELKGNSQVDGLSNGRVDMGSAKLGSGLTVNGAAVDAKSSTIAGGVNLTGEFFRQEQARLPAA